MWQFEEPGIKINHYLSLQSPRFSAWNHRNTSLSKDFHGILKFIILGNKTQLSFFRSSKSWSNQDSLTNWSFSWWMYKFPLVIIQIISKIKESLIIIISICNLLKLTPWFHKCLISLCHHHYIIFLKYVVCLYWFRDDSAVGKDLETYSTLIQQLGSKKKKKREKKEKLRKPLSLKLLSTVDPRKHEFELYSSIYTWMFFQ